MNIGDVSRASGLPAKTIRYYEDIGLVRPARGANGYRDFSEQDAHKLAFLGRSRSLGFTIEDCRTLMSLYEDRDRAASRKRSTSFRRLSPRSKPLSCAAKAMTAPIARFSTISQDARL